MFAVLQGGFGQFKMRPDRGDHGDNVDLRGTEKVRGVRGQLDIRKVMVRPSKRCRILIADRTDPTIFETVKIPRYIRAPVSVSDHPYANKIIWLSIRADLQLVS